MSPAALVSPAAIEPSQLFLMATLACRYDAGGFLINNAYLEGAVLLSGDLSTLWRVSSFADITEDSLSLLLMMRPAPGEQHPSTQACWRLIAHTSLQGFHASSDEIRASHLQICWCWDVDPRWSSSPSRWGSGWPHMGLQWNV